MRHVILSLALVLLLAGPGWGAQTELDTDSFGGTNGDALSTYDANWNNWGSASTSEVAIRGTPGIGMSSGANSASYSTAATWTNDQWAELTVDGTNLPDVTFGKFWVAVRTQTGTAWSGYVCGINYNAYGDYKYRIGQYDAGSYTNHTVATSETMSTSDIVNCQVEGTVITIKVTRGGSTYYTTTYDTVSEGTKYSSGNPGLAFGHGTATDRLAGTWRAGSVTAASSTACSLMLLGVGSC